MLIHREAVIEIAHHQCVNHFQLGHQDRQQAQMMHRAQRVGSMRFIQDFAQMPPKLCALGRGCRQRRQHLFNASLGAGTQFQTVMREKMK